MRQSKSNSWNEGPREDRAEFETVLGVLAELSKFIPRLILGLPWWAIYNGLLYRGERTVMPSGLGLIKGSLRANKEPENKCPGQK